MERIRNITLELLKLKVYKKIIYNTVLLQWLHKHVNIFKPLLDALKGECYYYDSLNLEELRFGNY